ncbi:hypothetical protein [Pseudalkalibacillus caeni]|uniref:ParB/Sulfiredoxin domain-containing protein n=1 Tax=Exobacillus caeni TaxID=2574798 RepID=A0A5R9F3K8_9BACL|nr:hypothetical protein [Pseudalkalibacillus caeni]TLS35483.1 hypothetical protein FCL54_19845 [Pseudalkalibacillus caeni]
MKFTVQYIPLSKIKADRSIKVTEQLKKLQRLVWDCMYLLVVRKNGNDGFYTLLDGLERFEHLKKRTKNIYAPCIIAKSRPSRMKSLFAICFNKQPLDDFPMKPVSWSIVRSFLKQEPRFSQLSRTQQIKVLILGIRYKRTVIGSMRARINQMTRD